MTLTNNQENEAAASQAAAKRDSQLGCNFCNQMFVCLNEKILFLLTNFVSSFVCAGKKNAGPKTPPGGTH